MMTMDDYEQNVCWCITIAVAVAVAAAAATNDDDDDDDDNITCAAEVQDSLHIIKLTFHGIKSKKQTTTHIPRNTFIHTYIHTNVRQTHYQTDRQTARQKYFQVTLYVAVIHTFIQPHTHSYVLYIHVDIRTTQKYV